MRTTKFLTLGMMVAGILSVRAAALPITVLFNGTTVSIDARADESGDLWVLPEDLPKVNGFVLKPEGACLDSLCIPVRQSENSALFEKRDDQGWFNVGELARRLDQAVAHEAEARVWSLGEVPAAKTAYFASAIAPDFELKDRSGKRVRLSDFRGKKVLLLTTASWCQCRLDLPGWQAVYDELKDKNFELIVAAQDTGGEAAAGPWFDRAQASFTQIVDENHVISRLYNMVNVPTGVWINEEGVIVRPNESAYSRDVRLSVGGKSISVDGGAYVDGLRDWVAKGPESAYALTPDEVTKRVVPRTADEALAEAWFQLGNHFHRGGDAERANGCWEKAEALRPDSWNYHRQDWSFTPSEANTNWLRKFVALGDRPYYEPLALPSAGN